MKNEWKKTMTDGHDGRPMMMDFTNNTKKTFFPSFEELLRLAFEGIKRVLSWKMGLVVGGWILIKRYGHPRRIFHTPYFIKDQD